GGGGRRAPGPHGGGGGGEGGRGGEGQFPAPRKDPGGKGPDPADAGLPPQAGGRAGRRPVPPLAAGQVKIGSPPAPAEGRTSYCRDRGGPHPVPSCPEGGSGSEPLTRSRARPCPPGPPLFRSIAQQPLTCGPSPRQCERIAPSSQPASCSASARIGIGAKSRDS